MSATSVQKLARVLKVLVTITFVCNLIALVLVPGLTMLRGIQRLFLILPEEKGGDLAVQIVVFFLRCWKWVWLAGPHDVVLALFLLFCGVCTAVILWQARRVLGTILRADTFSMANASNMGRAGICCFLISLGALIRLVWGMVHYETIRVLFTYNALFIPIFFMGGLLCLVMSALFRQAAELKGENDLTI